MKIEDGKYYKTRDGRKVGPLQATPYYPDYPWTVDDGALMYNSEGRRITEYAGDDLIAEWTDGPVRTVTRREVVPGPYGRVWVGEVRGKEIGVALNGMVSQDELKAAAAVLLELAGALDSE